MAAPAAPDLSFFFFFFTPPLSCGLTHLVDFWNVAGEHSWRCGIRAGIDRCDAYTLWTKNGIVCFSSLMMGFILIEVIIGYLPFHFAAIRTREHSIVLHTARS